jgi:hypothetical protein
MASTHHERPAGVARRLQFAEYPVRTANAQSSDILNDDPSWAALDDQTPHVPP